MGMGQTLLQQIITPPSGADERLRGGFINRGIENGKAGKTLAHRPGQRAGGALGL
jgi:hypothetical protein